MIGGNNMTFKCYSKIKVVTDKYERDGISKGTLGIILEIYDEDNYEVQFLDENNELSNIFFAVKKDDFVLDNNI